MRVWMINQYAIPPAQAGGTRHYALAKELIARGHDVTIIASSFDHVTRQETRLAAGESWKREVVEGVPFLWLRTPPYPGNTAARTWNMILFSLRLWVRTGLKSLPRPEAIIGSSPHLFGALAGERLAAHYGVPFVLEVRDLWPQSLVELGKVPAGHPVVKGLTWMERYLYRRACRIITLLPGAAEHMVSKGALREKVVWLPNGVDLAAVHAQPRRSQSERLTVMYAGTHGLANGLDTLLDAAAILQQDGWSERIRIRLIGDGPEKARLERRAATEGLRLVSFEPPVPKARVFELLQEADLCFLSLKKTPLFRWGVSPNKLFDYLISARPVLFAVDTPYDVVAENAAGITVPPEDPQATAEAIKYLATLSHEERRAMGARGQAYVKEYHGFQGLADQLEEQLWAIVRA